LNNIRFLHLYQLYDELDIQQHRDDLFLQQNEEELNNLGFLHLYQLYDELDIQQHQDDHFRQHNEEESHQI